MGGVPLGLGSVVENKFSSMLELVYMYITLQPLRRHGSMTRRSRPLNTFISRRGSFQVSRSDSNSTAGHRRSLSSRSSLIGLGSLPDQVALTGRDSIASIASQRGSMDAFSYTSRETLNVVKRKTDKSKSCEEMELKLLFASCKLIISRVHETFET